MKARKTIAISILALSLAVTVGFALLWLQDNKLPNFKEEYNLYVRPGMTADDVRAELSAVARHPASLKRAFRSKQVHNYLKCGHFVVRPSHSSVYVARMLNNGWQTPVKLTLSGSLRLRGEIASRIASQMMMDSTEVRAAMEDKELLACFGVTPETVFSLFVPDTYEVFWTDSMRDIFSRQKKALDNFWTQDRQAKAAALGLSRMQVAVLASIVRSESYHESEYPSVASVYRNRLRKGMKLQACPTVMFLYDFTLNRLLKSHIQAKKDSPYNTYTHFGLPPAPICVPSKASLDAVLNPAGEEYLYFCADSRFNGYNVFSKTYAEHCRKAREYQKAFNERQKARQQASK